MYSGILEVLVKISRRAEDFPTSVVQSKNTTRTPEMVTSACRHLPMLCNLVTPLLGTRGPGTHWISTVQVTRVCALLNRLVTGGVRGKSTSSFFASLVENIYLLSNWLERQHLLSDRLERATRVSASTQSLLDLAKPTWYRLRYHWPNLY